MPDFLSLIDDEIVVARLKKLSEVGKARLNWKNLREIKRRLDNLPQHEPKDLDFTSSTIRIGEDLPEDHPVRTCLSQVAQALIPWKKGPFRLYGIQIDAEWQSDYKWDRFAHNLPDLRDQVILDVGCNNGYYLFRMMPFKPRFILGIDPIPRLWCQFHLLQHYARVPNIELQMWGWEELDLFKDNFDTIFCMGILYHHTDPIRLLRHLYGALRPGGLLVLETIVIPGNNAYCLFPEDRYARMRNVWFIPTVTTLYHMLHRTKFANVETVSVNKHESEEQRSTPWNPGPSYADFIDPADPNKTVEGHPAPHRAIIFARKK